MALRAAAGLWLVPSLLLMMFLKRTRLPQAAEFDGGVRRHRAGADAADRGVLRGFGASSLAAHGPASACSLRNWPSPPWLSFWRTSSPGARRPSIRAIRCTRPRWPSGLVILAVVVADLGTAVVLGVTATVVFFVAGLRWRFCAIAGGCALVGTGGLHRPQALPAGAPGRLCRPRLQDHLAHRSAAAISSNTCINR